MYEQLVSVWQAMFTQAEPSPGVGKTSDRVCGSGNFKRVWKHRESWRALRRVNCQNEPAPQLLRNH